jgi:hypothetical protein
MLPRLVSRLAPLNALANYQGMQPFVDYLARFTRDELMALLELAEMNVDKHKWVIANPGTTVIGMLIALYVGVLGLEGAGFHVPDALKGGGLVAGGAFSVLLYIVLVGLVGQVLARALLLRDLLKIAVQEKATLAPTATAAAPDAVSHPREP